MLCEACTLRLRRDGEISIECLFESPALYVLESEVSALVTTHTVWNSDKDKECPDDYGIILPWIMALVYIETTVTLNDK